MPQDQSSVQSSLFSLQKIKRIFSQITAQYIYTLIPISLIGVLFSAFEIILIPSFNTLELWLYIAIFSLFFLLPLRPILFSVFIIVSGNILSISFTVHQNEAPFVFTCTLFALGILAARIRLFYALLAYSFSVLVHLVRISLSGDFSSFVLLSVAAIYTTAVLAGLIVKLWRQTTVVRQKQLENEIELQRLANLRQRDRIAIQLHDSLTNELTNISYIARNILNIDGNNINSSVHDNNSANNKNSVNNSTNNDIGNNDMDSDVMRVDNGGSFLDESMRESWLLVLSQTQSAFRQVRRIISLLSDSDSLDEQVVSFNERIREVAMEREKYLVGLGYVGRIEVVGLVDAVSDDLADEVISLLVELSNNIRRHAVPGMDNFDIFVDLKPDLIVIRALNDCTTDKKISEDEKSGRGLQLHRKEIHRLGGTLSTRLEEKIWMLRAEFPIGIV